MKSCYTWWWNSGAKQERLRKELEERKAKEAKDAQEAEERRKAEEEAARKKAEEEGEKSGSTGNGEEETEPEQVEIDGTLYTLDDNGNAVDDNGEIKFTKEQLMQCLMKVLMN